VKNKRREGPPASLCEALRAGQTVHIDAKNGALEFKEK
jgi:hypothetical protein